MCIPLSKPKLPPPPPVEKPVIPPPPAPPEPAPEPPEPDDVEEAGKRRARRNVGIQRLRIPLNVPSGGAGLNL